MPRPATQSELLDTMAVQFEALHDEVAAVDPADLEIPGACELWSVKDILAHLDAWHEMFLEWEALGSAGGSPEMPAPGLSWKETPVLNERIWQRTRGDDYEIVVARLGSSYDRVRKVISGYGPDDLFTKRRYNWTGSTSAGSYAVSATSSHYEWARKLIRKFNRDRRSPRTNR